LLLRDRKLSVSLCVFRAPLQYARVCINHANDSWKASTDDVNHVDSHVVMKFHARSSVRIVFLIDFPFLQNLWRFSRDKCVSYTNLHCSKFSAEIRLQNTWSVLAFALRFDMYSRFVSVSSRVWFLHTKSCVHVIISCVHKWLH
jgi:hypothetical protein